MANYVIFVVSFCWFLQVESIQSIMPTFEQASRASLVESSKPNLGSVNRLPSMIPIVLQANSSLVAAKNVTQESTPIVNSCTCGVFLTDQFVKGSSKPPSGYPPVSKEIDEQVTCNGYGVKQCINRCVDSLVSFMPKSGDLICASIDRDCFKQRAFLFVNNCNQGWFNTKFSAGKEFCCKNGEYHKCPL